MFSAFDTQNVANLLGTVAQVSDKQVTKNCLEIISNILDLDNVLLRVQQEMPMLMQRVDGLAAMWQSEFAVQQLRAVVQGKLQRRPHLLSELKGHSVAKLKQGRLKNPDYFVQLQLKSQKQYQS